MITIKISLLFTFCCFGISLSVGITLNIILQFTAKPHDPLNNQNQ